jgi:hypothetical protein
LRSPFDYDQVFAGATGEFHRPLGPRWQLDLDGQAMLPVRKESDGFEEMSSGVATFLVSDRWNAGVSLAQQRSVRKDATSGLTQVDSWSCSYGVAVTYYVEDRLTINGGSSEAQAHNRSSSGFEAGGRQQQFFVSLGYRFMGSFAASGLIAAQNLAGPR